MSVLSTEIQTLIYKTEFYIINKDYEVLQDQEYGITFINEKSASKIQLIRMLLKGLKIQYNIDPTAEIASRLYYKIKELVGLDLSTLPAINTDLVIYSANVDNTLFGAVVIATYPELLANLTEDADKVVSVSVFNQYFSGFQFNVRIYKAVISTTNGLIINHNLNTTQISVQFHTSAGPIFCDYIIIDTNSIQLVSNLVVNNVNIVVLG